MPAFEYRVSIRLIQVGGSLIVRRGIADYLGEIDDIDVVGDLGETAGRLGEVIEKLAPDVLLLHQRGTDPDDGVTDWIGDVPDGQRPSVLLMHLPGRPAEVWRTVRAGVNGFVDEDDRPEELVKAIRCLAAGEAWLPPPYAQELVDHYRHNTVDRGVGDGREAGVLSRRERSVVRLVALGYSNAEIAAELKLAESTVKTHVSRVLRKLELRDRTQLAHFAHEANLV